MDIRFLQAKHFVQAQRIWRGQAMTLCFGGLVGFKNHIEHKESDEHPENAGNVAGGDDQHDKDQNMCKGLYELAVIHCSYARNESEQACHYRAGRTGYANLRRWRNCAGYCSGSCSLQSCGDARFAIDGAHHVAFAFFAKRFAARTAVRYCLGLIVYGAVHIWAPSCHVKVWAIKLPSRSML